MNLKDVVKELEPFIAADPIGEMDDKRYAYGSHVHLHVVARTAESDPVDLETGAPCAESTTFDISCPFGLGRRRYAYLKRKERVLQRDQELNAELALAVYEIAKRLAFARELAEPRGYFIHCVPQEVRADDAS